MSEEEEGTIDLSDRMAAMDAVDPKRQGKRRGARPAAGKSLGGLVAIGLIGGLAYMLVQTRQEAEEALATAEPEDWQGTGDGFGEVAPPATAAVVQVIPASARPADPPVEEPDEPSEAEQASMETLEALKAEVEEMRAQAAQAGEERVSDDASSAQIDALSAQIEDLTAQTETLQAEARAAANRARESDAAARLLQAQLDAGSAVHGGTEEPLGLGTDEDAAALKELTDRQATAEEARQARIASPVIAFGGSSVAPPAGAEATGASGLGQNEDFLRQGARAANVEQAVVIANPGRTVIQGTVIQAALETAVDSSLPGAIRAVVSEDVHSYDGSRVLIPRGSKLIGRYNSQVEPTQRRLMVAWDRIVTPDGQSVTISAYGADELGRSGTTGRIDRRLGTRFGSAALVSLISALPSAAAASVDDPLAADLAEELGEDAEDAAGSVLDQYLSVPPTIYIDQGTRITVMVDRDLELY